MPFQVIQPPSEEQALAAASVEIVKAGEKLGLNLDVQGFISAWVTGVRVLVERDAEGEIVTLCLMALGKTWTRQNYTANLLELVGNDPDGMLDYAKNIAAALGVIALFHDATEPFPTPVDGVVKRTVHQYNLQ